MNWKAFLLLILGFSCFGYTAPVENPLSAADMAQQKAGEVTLTPEILDQLLLSYWRKKGGRLLAVVSNLSDKTFSGHLRFKETSPRIIRPMGSEKNISVKGGETFPVSIPAKDYQLYLITLPES